MGYLVRNVRNTGNGMSSVALADWELDFEFWNVRVKVLIMCILYKKKRKKKEHDFERQLYC